MSRGFRQIAIFLIFVFMANVQAWAFTMEDEASHDSTTGSHLVQKQLDDKQRDSHDCAQSGEHCCHACSHLLGQVSDSFVLSKLSQEPKSFPMGVVNATSTYPEGIYRPPRSPSLT